MGQYAKVAQQFYQSNVKSFQKSSKNSGGVVKIITKMVPQWRNNALAESQLGRNIKLEWVTLLVADPTTTDTHVLSHC